MSEVLIIGGSRFMGRQLVWQLILAGHEVTIVNRGTHPDPFGDRVERLRADRTTPAFAEVLAHRRFDAAVDFAAYTGADARGALEALQGSVDHYIVISTGQVYLVRTSYPIPSREGDYEGPVIPEPSSPEHAANWHYGVGKREVEDVLVEAWERDQFPSTRLRIPVVNGERDYARRLESYLWRILDGGPIILPDGGSQHVRQAYSGSVVRTIVDNVLGQQHTFGKAYNLCQDEIPTVAELVMLLADIMGARPEIVPMASEALEAADLHVTDIFPFTSPWNSMLDPSRAKIELGFQHDSLPLYLERIVACFINYLPDDQPEFNAHRAAEIALAR